MLVDAGHNRREGKLAGGSVARIGKHCLRRDEFIGGSMNPRIARGIAWSLVGVYIILGTAGLALQAVANTPFVDIGIPGAIVTVAIAGVWTVTGALIVSRHPQHPVGWLLCLGIIFAAIDMFAYGYAVYDTYVYPGSLLGVDLAFVWIRLGGAFPFSLAAFNLILLLFPDGHLPSPGWRKLAWITAGALLILIPVRAIEPGVVEPSLLPFISNPLGVDPSLWVYLAPLKWVSFSILALCYASALLSMVFRLRRARGIERQQIKWLLYPAGLYGISLPFIVLSSEQANDQIMGIAIVLGIPALMGMIAGTAFAIFKYRLYDIDLIINRALVYSALSGTLGLVYFMSVVLLQQVFPAGSQVTIVLSTLASAALFTPLRRRLQNTIDRRFYRQKYDAQQTLAAFSLKMRDEVELEQLSETLLAVVDKTMQPDHASIWLKDQIFHVEHE